MLNETCNHIYLHQNPQPGETVSLFFEAIMCFLSMLAQSAAPLSKSTLLCISTRLPGCHIAAEWPDGCSKAILERIYKFSRPSTLFTKPVECPLDNTAIVLFALFRFPSPSSGWSGPIHLFRSFRYLTAQYSFSKSVL